MSGQGPSAHVNTHDKIRTAITNICIDEKRRPIALKLAPTRTDTGGSAASHLSLRTPRTPRFAEATSVHSPIDGKGKSPFDDPDNEMSEVPQPQPGDVGFGYINNNNRESMPVPMTPKTPLKSAMKVPGTPARFMNPMSPTFREEAALDKREEHTEKEQARDVVCF